MEKRKNQKANVNIRQKFAKHSPTNVNIRFRKRSPSYLLNPFFLTLYRSLEIKNPLSAATEAGDKKTYQQCQKGDSRYG